MSDMDKYFENQGSFQDNLKEEAREIAPLQGTHALRLTQVEQTKNLKGEDQTEMTFSVVEGPAAGRLWWWRYVAGRDWQTRHYAQLCHACGFSDFVRDASHLVGRVVVAKLKAQGKYSNVTAFMRPESSTPPAPQPAAASPWNSQEERF